MILGCVSSIRISIIQPLHLKLQKRFRDFKSQRISAPAERYYPLDTTKKLPKQEWPITTSVCTLPWMVHSFQLWRSSPRESSSKLSKDKLDFKTLVWNLSKQMSISVIVYITRKTFPSLNKRIRQLPHIEVKDTRRKNVW